MDRHPFVLLLFALGLTYALYKIFEDKLKDIFGRGSDTDAQKGYITFVVGVVLFIGLYIFVNRYIGCGYISHSGRSNK